MKNILTIGLCLIFSVSLFSQLETYDLSKYKLADYQFRSLNTAFSFDGATNSQIDQFDFNEKQSFYYFKPEIDLNYFQFKNTRKRQVFNAPRFGLGYHHGAKDNSDKRNWSFSTQFSQDYESKFFNEKDQFLAIGADYDLSYYSAQYFNFSGSGKYESFFTQIEIPFSAGIGRVENVTDAWQSVRILKDLKRFGFVKSELGEEDIKAFADFINKRQQLRFFDSRLKRIEDLEELDAYLESTDLIGEKNATYFAALYDMWLFGINAQRRAGNSFSVGLAPTFNRIVDKDAIGGFDPRFRHAGLNSFLKYEYHKPVSLKLQFDLSAALNIGVQYDLEENQPSPQTLFRPDLILSLGYYPTSRTELTSSLRTSYVSSDDDFRRNFYGEGLSIASDTQLNYYLSPQTRLSGYLSFGFMDAERNGICGSIYNSGYRRLIPNSGQEDCNYSNFGIRLTHSFL